jgi:hypothetical protein
MDYFITKNGIFYDGYYFYFYEVIIEKWIFIIVGLYLYKSDLNV